MPVREFHEQDFPAVCRIYLEAKGNELRREKGTITITPLDQDAAILAAFKESTVLIFEEKEVLGFAALFNNQLRAMFVRGDARGMGVGQALLDAARSANLGEMFLNVAKSNTGAQRFYARNGFAAIGEVPLKYDGTTITYVRMKSTPPRSTPFFS